MGEHKRPKSPQNPREHAGSHEHQHEQRRDVERETTGGGPAERSDRDAIGRPIQLDDKDAIGWPTQLDDKDRRRGAPERPAHRDAGQKDAKPS